MKLSKLFHSLYAMVMFLPIFIIPIFALNILHKETEPISITTGGWEIQNKYETNEVNSLSDIIDYNIYTYDSEQICYLIDDYGENYTARYLSYYDINEGTLIVVDGYIECYTNPNELFLYAGIDIAIPYGVEVNIVFENNVQLNTGLDAEGYTIGKECTNLPKEYVYNEGHVYNNTDIGSQFVYALYKPVHDYFNFGDFFGLGGMYDWFQLNIFNGTSPLTFFIVFNVMIYWLFISLFWLIFDVLMYVPNMIHKMLDKARLE